MSYTHKLRILRASWGIAIDLTAEYVNIAVPPTDAIPISKNIYLRINANNLIAEERAFIANGLVFVAKQIETKINNTILIDITSVEFSECDYQPEGLMCAVIGWAAHKFDLTDIEYTAHFDKNANSYIF